MVFLPPVGGALQLPLVEVVELVAIAGLVACTVWLGRRGTPATLERRQKAVERTCAELGATVDETSALRATWRADLERVSATVEDYFARIEKKRASIASSTSRAERAAANAQPAAISELPRAQQIELARRAFEAAS